MTFFRVPWAQEATNAEPGFAPARPPPRLRGRPPAATRQPTGPAPWLYHHLIVTGPPATVDGFREAARGAGIIPWATDGHEVEAFVFDLAASQPPARRALSIDACRMLARQFRERYEAHHQRAAAAFACSRRCPLDLHALLPVPAAILRLGAADPDAVAWLATYWGVADRLRHAAERPDFGPGRRLPRGHRTLGYGFFTGGDTPAAAIAQLSAWWPGLRFLLRQRSD